MKRHLSLTWHKVSRPILCGVAAVGLLAALNSSVLALVVAQPSTGTWPTTTAPPADDPGWSNVTASGRNFIYLGDGWALSARHVGPPIPETEPGDSPQSLAFSTGIFQIIPGQNFVVRNPTDAKNSSGQTINLSTEADLRLVRLNGDPGLPSIFDDNPQFRIASQSLPVSGEVTFIGHGRTRDGDLQFWNPSSNPPWQSTTSCSSESNNCRSGYEAMDPNDDTLRWGRNRLENVNSFHNPGPLDEVLSTSTGILDINGRDTASLLTVFDKSGVVNEAQAVDKDSGSAVFYKRGGQWELAGIVNAILTFDDQPGRTAVYNNATTFADLSFYYHTDPLQDYSGSISDIIREHANYSIMGDVNLDGLVTGDGTGSAASDDVAAFAAGWMFQQAEGDMTSWKNGDLDLNGVTDVDDFFLLRDALLAAGSPAGAASLENLFGGMAGIPEPATISLAWLAAGLFACRRQRTDRRRSA